jgi:hypothetical protein
MEVVGFFILSVILIGGIMIEKKKRLDRGAEIIDLRNRVTFAKTKDDLRKVYTEAMYYLSENTNEEQRESLREILDDARWMLFNVKGL